MRTAERQTKKCIKMYIRKKRKKARHSARRRKTIRIFNFLSAFFVRADAFLFRVTAFLLRAGGFLNFLNDFLCFTQYFFEKSVNKVVKKY